MGMPLLTSQPSCGGNDEERWREWKGQKGRNRRKEIGRIAWTA